METFEQLYEMARANPARFALVVGGVWLLFWIETRRCTARIRAWCDGHGYRLIRARRQWRPFGAFPLKSRGQSEWRITAEDLKLGGRRRGHALVGGFFSGLASDEVAVEWEFTAQELSNGLDLPGARTG